MSERSEQRRGEEDWRAGAESPEPAPRSRAWIVWLIAALAAAAAAFFFLRK